MEPPSRKNAWEAVDSLCEPLVDSRVPLFEALQNALPVIMEEDLDSEEAKRRMPQLLKISRLLIGHLLSTQQQLVADKKNLQEKNRQLKTMQQELTREILSTPSWSFFKCEACQKIFISEKFLQRHLVGRHTQRKKK